MQDGWSWIGDFPPDTNTACMTECFLVGRCFYGSIVIQMRHRASLHWTPTLTYLLRSD